MRRHLRFTLFIFSASFVVAIMNMQAGNSMFRGLIAQGTTGGGGGGGGVTVNTDWGYSSCSSSPGGCNITSPTRTLTVPVGNSGSIELDSFGVSGNYSKNGGAFGSFTSGTNITVASGDTLAFRKSLTPGNTWTLVIRDNTTMGVVGEVDFENTGSPP